MRRTRLFATVAASFAFASSAAMANLTQSLDPQLGVGSTATYSDVFATTPATVDTPTSGTSAGIPFNFYDDFTFTVTASEAGLVSIASTISFSALAGISNLQARLFSGTGGPFYSTVAQPAILEKWGTSFTAGTAVGSTVILAPVTPIAAGTYTLELRGTATAGPILSAAYTGQLSVTPVPEPRTWAMIAAGLGVIGVGLRRRG